MAYLRLIRYQNLLMLALMQLILRYGFLKHQDTFLALSDVQYVLLVLSTVLIAAAGYVINDIFDQATDADNKPEKVVVGRYIPESKAYNLYFALNVTGVSIGFYLSNVVGHPGFAAIFIAIAGTLYIYASGLKQMLLVGNVVVALMLALSVLIIPVFDLYPATYDGNRKMMATLFSVIFDYAGFAFVINFLRELVKDLEDIDGDYNQGMSTLPIVMGISRTAMVAFALGLLPTLYLLYYINAYYIANNLWIAAVYTLLFIVGPLIYFVIRMWAAKTKKEFHHLSFVLKLVILMGILSVAVVTYNIAHHG